MMLTAVVLTKNNPKDLQRCLASLNFCEEILLIDDYSKKRIEEIAKKYRAKILRHRLQDDFAAQRNFGIKKSQNDWVLFLDSDEIIPTSLRNEIQSLNPGLSTAGYMVKRKNYIFGRLVKYGDYKNDYVVRLVKKGSGAWKRRVHELWETNKSIDKLTSPIIHHPHKSITHFVNKTILYSQIHAGENARERKRVNMFIVIFKPILKFYYLYLLKLGILDGTVGFILAGLSAFHSFSAWSQYYISKD